MNGTTSHSYEFSVAPPTAALVKQPLVVPKDRLLMGPGPSNCSPRVCEASSHQILGHMHPEFAQVLDDIKLGLQYLFQTSNPHTLVISGPGHLGMEAVLVNLLEPGDTILVGVNGLWGHRVADLGNRIGAKPVTIETEPGKSFSLAEIEAGLAKHKPHVLFLVHSESSTGVMQNLEGVGALCRKYGCLLAVDTVASLGGTPFFTDKLGIDAIYTGSQKVIGAPPGLSPISFSAAAVDKIQKRKSPIKSFLLDLNLLSVYWACGDKAIPRVYHHTPPVSLLYAMREALAALVEEGLEALWARHADATKRLHDGIKELGLEFFVPNPADRLPTVTTIKIPEGLKDWKLVPKHAMDKFEVELAGGLGETAGKVYRIGVMGFNSTPDKIQRTLSALKESLKFAKL